ncbi:MAG: hypothetical protein LBV74_07420 [Tannerella sp.]|jgi:hypothetical protein|nr:hypothetical protein [Tannerella sp.]
MKDFIILLFLLPIPALLSCSGEDKTNILLPERPELSDNIAADAQIKELYKQYGVWFRYEFPPETFTYDWSDHLTDPEYTPADVNSVSEVLDSVRSWVFDVFPYQFLAAYLPLNVLLTDSLTTSYSVLDGHLATNYIALGRVGKQFGKQDMNHLREAWVSLFIEKMVISHWKYPAEFASFNPEAYNELAYETGIDLTVRYALLKSGRNGLYNNRGRLCPTTYAQDFGDYVAFILYRNTTEKKEYYDKNEMVKKKENSVRDYFYRDFGFRLEAINP